MCMCSLPSEARVQRALGYSSCVEVRSSISWMVINRPIIEE